MAVSRRIRNVPFIYFFCFYWSVTGHADTDNLLRFCQDVIGFWVWGFVAPHFQTGKQSEVTGDLRDGYCNGKQTIYIAIIFYDIQTPGLHTIQYWNIYKVVVILVKNNKKRKNYLHRGSCTPCGKMTHKENLEQSQKPFLRAPII